MQIIDNINTTAKGDLQATIHKGSKLSIAAACFSIYAYQELKKQLEGIDARPLLQKKPPKPSASSIFPVSPGNAASMGRNLR